MKKLFFLFFLLLCSWCHGQNEVIEVDSSKPFAWGTLSHYHTRDSLNCAQLARISTTLRRSSLVIQLDWNDEVIDSKPISQEIRRWKDPEGVTRDKDLMYFYDGLGIRLFFKKSFYEGWVRPLDQSGWEVQWENTGSMTSRTSRPIDLIELEISGQVISIRISMGELGWTIQNDETLKITLIATDADTPQTAEIKSRVQNGASYCTSTKAFTISNN